MRGRIGAKLRLERREVFHHQRRQKTIFTEREQILLVQCIHVRLGVFFNDTVRDDNGSSFIGCADTVQGETTRQTCDGAKKTFECFGQVMRDVVFVDLNHRPPGAFFVRELGFATNSNDAGIIRTRSHQSIERIRCNSLNEQGFEKE